MDLMTFPAEILSLILEAVGSEEFRSGLELLTVCKAWFQIAQPVMVKIVTSSAATLTRFPPISPRVRQLLRTHIRTLSVQLHGFDSNWSHPGTGYDGDNRKEYSLADWAKEANLRVHGLVVLLPDFPRIAHSNFEYQVVSIPHMTTCGKLMSVTGWKLELSSGFSGI